MYEHLTRAPQIGDQIRFSSQSHGESTGKVVDVVSNGRRLLIIGEQFPCPWRVKPTAVLAIIEPGPTVLSIPEQLKLTAVAARHHAAVTQYEEESRRYLLCLLAAGTIKNDFDGVVR